MFKRFVLDTSSIISYFSEAFEGSDKNDLSQEVKEYIKKGVHELDDVILIIPNVVFVEIYAKWFKSEESREKIRFQVLEPLKESKNVEFKTTSKEVLFHIVDSILESPIPANFDNHDKQILASAIELYSVLVSSDEKIQKFAKTTNCIPDVIF